MPHDDASNLLALAPALFDECVDCVALYGHDGRLLYTNRALDELLGSFMITGSVEELRRRERDFNQYTWRMLEAMATGQPTRIDLNFGNLSRRALHHVRFSPIIDASGAVLGALGVGRDSSPLRTVEQRLGIIAENLPDLVAHIDAAHRYTYVSPAMARLVGDPGAVGRTVREVALFLAADIDRIDASVARVLATGQMDALATELVVDGVTRYFELRHVPERDLDDLVVGVMSLARDVTEGRRAEDALRASEARYRNLFDELPVGVWEQDFSAAKAFVAGLVPEVEDVAAWFEAHPQDLRRCAELVRVTEVNKAGIALIGAPAKEAALAGITPLLTPDGEAKFATEVPRMLSGAQRRFAVDTQLQTLTGERRDVTIMVSVCPGFEESLGRVLVLITDITARRRAEERLRKLSRAVEQSPVSIVITNTGPEIEYVNPKFTEVTGYTSAEVQGRNPRLLGSGERTPSAAELWPTLLAGKTWRGEFHNRRKNGELFWELATISPVTDERGHTTHFLAVKEDVTEHKRLEEALRQSQKMDALGQLAAGIAHDFNNMITVIAGNADLARFDPREADQALIDIADAASRAGNLTHQLLAFGRKSATSREALDLDAVVDDTVRLLRRVIGGHIAIDTRSAGVAPVLADRGMMEQVLVNLAVNARDAMPHGGHLAISTERVAVGEAAAAVDPRRRAGDFVRLEVTDSGAGISTEDLRHIFEPFFTTKEVGRGTGLGLATVFGIVQAHGGWIEVRSRVGHGATFQVFLPLRGPEPAAATQRPAPHTHLGGSELVLVVEDDALVQSLVRRTLEQHGYRTLTATTGAAALGLWATHRREVSMLLTDLLIPGGMRGDELARQLQAQEPGLPVLCCSGNASDTFGAPEGWAFLAKPFVPAALLAKVRECLTSGREPLPAR